MQKHQNHQKQYWLMKTEPDVFSLDDLQKAPRRTTAWEGVRNYQARNFMRDRMRVGDEVLFYHSNAEPSGIAGLARITSEAYPDPSALDPRSDYFDAKAKPDRNPWMMVEVTFVRAFPRVIALNELRATPGLDEMLVIRRGMRLSIQPVTQGEYETVLRLAECPQPALISANSSSFRT